MEYWDLYNKNGKFKHRVIKRGMEIKNGQYHLVSEGWILRSDNKFIIQRRSLNKSTFPGMWYCSAGGSVISGENSKEGMKREFFEELGLDLALDEIKLKRIIYGRNSIFHIFLVKKDFALDEITMQKEEVMDVRLASAEEILQMVDRGIFIGLNYYRDFFKKIQDEGK
ncbi:NUDIX domain-containing protein [uncultured Peptoniphilus sp.]|uniref:NUDIX hydrolase n=1 Tax=uncultured Peptoniphilus sp. TaxID=254354 RepID=UPI002803A8B3|nr:NUDIX domain-containing protein [uncultured Peptoniphilus sp.]